MDHLRSAIRKCEHQYKKNWGGYLLSLEVLALRDIGLDMDQHDVDWAIDCKRNGRMYGRWIYFDANNKFEILKGFAKMKAKVVGRKVKIEYHSIQSDHILAVPQFSHSEVVEYTNEADLKRYIESKKDEYGNHYRKRKVKTFGFDYTSSAGAVKVKPYKPPKIKRI